MLLVPGVRPERETVARAKVESVYAREVLGQERLDSLRAGRLLEAGGPVFGASLRRAEFELALRAEAA